MTWNGGISGGSFTTSGNPPTGQFCWTPTSPGTYAFTVTVKDDACPLNGTQIYAYTIYVSQLSVTGSSTNVSCNGGTNGSVNVSVAGTSSYSYLWSNGQVT